MMKQFDVIIEKDSEGYFIASVPALKGCHTQAKSLDVLMERIKEAIELCLEVQGELSEPLDFVGVQRISVAAWHLFQVELAKIYCLPWKKLVFLWFELGEAIILYNIQMVVQRLCPSTRVKALDQV
jgi:predicted RNase H-like HicB family nuclease